MSAEDFFDNYRKAVDATSSEYIKEERLAEKTAEISKWLKGNYARMDLAVNGLTGEAGEVSDLWKKIKFHGKELSPELKDNMISELGDVCWYLMQAAKAMDVTIEEIITRNIAKLQKRHRNGFYNGYMNKKEDQ